MSWEEADWENYKSDDGESEEDEAVKQLKAEALAEKNKPVKKSLAERKAEEAAEAAAKQQLIDEEVREQRRKRQEVLAKLGPNATEAQINKAMQEASEEDAVRDLFSVSASEAAAGGGGGGVTAAGAVATSCDVDLLDLIGEEEHKAFGEKLALKLTSMSTGPYITALLEALLKKLEPALQAADYQSIGRVAGLLQNTKTQQARDAQKKKKGKDKKQKPKLNTGTKSAGKGGFDDIMNADYNMDAAADAAADYMW